MVTTHYLNCLLLIIFLMSFAKAQGDPGIERPAIAKDANFTFFCIIINFDTNCNQTLATVSCDHS